MELTLGREPQVDERRRIRRRLKPHLEMAELVLRGRQPRLQGLKYVGVVGHVWPYGIACLLDLKHKISKFQRNLKNQPNFTFCVVVLEICA